MNLYNITKVMVSLLKAQPNMGDVNIGDVYEVNANQSVTYPACTITQRPHIINHDDGKIVFSFYVFCFDRLTDEKSNKIDCQNYAMNTLDNLVEELESYGIVSNPVIHTFEERLNDLCAGAYADFSVSVDEDICNTLDLQFITDKTLNENLLRYQEKLVSGVNLKTINNQSLLGEGNIEISGEGTSYQYYTETDDTANIDAKNINFTATGKTWNGYFKLTDSHFELYNYSETSPYFGIFHNGNTTNNAFIGFKKGGTNNIYAGIEFGFHDGGYTAWLWRTINGKTEGSGIVTMADLAVNVAEMKMLLDRIVALEEQVANLEKLIEKS